MRFKLCPNIFSALVCSLAVFSAPEVTATCNVGVYKGYNLCASYYWARNCGIAWSGRAYDSVGVLWSKKDCRHIGAENATDYLNCSIHYYPDTHPECIFRHHSILTNESTPDLQSEVE